MEKEYIRDLIYSVGGAKLPGEDTKEYLVRVSDTTKIGYSALRAAYYSQDTSDGRCVGSNGQPINEENIHKLERAAENARDTLLVVATIESQLARWETDPKKYRAFIDASREYLGRLRGDEKAEAQEGNGARREAETDRETGFLARYLAVGEGY